MRQTEKNPSLDDVNEQDKQPTVTGGLRDCSRVGTDVCACVSNGVPNRAASPAGRSALCRHCALGAVGKEALLERSVDQRRATKLLKYLHYE